MPRSERDNFILRNMYFADVMGILLKKISLFGNALWDTFIYSSHAVCLEGLGVSQWLEGLIAGFLATLILKILVRSTVLLEMSQNQNSGAKTPLI